jgi:sensor histidine kinase YesM
MTEKQARERGYQYHGAGSSYNDEKLQARLQEIRKAGNKAVIVTIPPNPYSRSSHRGRYYSIYWIESEKNRKARVYEDLMLKIRITEREKTEAEAKAIEAHIKLIRLYARANRGE